ncbi:MAG: hypothetical protein KAS67_07085 [Thermoplasmata archaeon]|nr:hypothetical protein [Thermoplasmata archaeon]
MMDDRAISSFSLLAIILLLLSSFTMSYIAYVTQVDMNYRMQSETLDDLEGRTLDVAQDLEDHAIYLVEKNITSGSDIGEEFQKYVMALGSENFDTWRSGDISVCIDGIYAVIGGTLHENYTLSLQNTGEGYLLSGSFNITARNNRSSLELQKTIKFERMIHVT